ncbi:Vacuolar protein sorting-associated protein 24-like 1 [Vitis vinifera]|uniref:Vacuolar protein sorting-associated protein 24-like 1 n=1 Tax=Vitis vinifera TaxID=29760 RepID=A0A438C2Y5_VITVI|nr:Vacuolar protein sorting-associated protein 24-like 1 [Vitis vinifera]
MKRKETTQIRHRQADSTNGEYIIGGVDHRILKTGVLGMEKVMNILKPKPNPQQQLRDWQRKLRQECRNIERQIRG